MTDLDEIFELHALLQEFMWQHYTKIGKDATITFAEFCEL